MPKKANTTSLRQEASFVFKGTVVKLNATLTPQIPKSDRTIVVRVDETIRAPESLAHYNGIEITVQLTGRKKVIKGQQLVFYTNGLLYGETLAVESVDQSVSQTVQAAAALVAPDPVKNLMERDILNRAAILRAKNFMSSTPMEILVDRYGVDQPYVQVGTVTSGPDKGKDRLCVGNNLDADDGGRPLSINR